MSILEELEKKQVPSSKPHASSREVALYFLGALLFMPFVLINAMFVPIFGQITSLIALVVTFFWLRRRKSLSLTLAYSSGAILPLLILMFFTTFIKARMDVILFVLLGCAIPMTLLYIILVSALLWRDAQPT